MAGSDTRFNAAKFRNGIRFAMQMGFPEDTSKQFTWHWTTKRTYLKPDSGGFPLEFKQSQIDTQVDVDDLVVDVAVSYTQTTSASRIGGTELGVFDVASITATLLDTDYATLLDHGDDVLPDQATVDGNLYIVQNWRPPVGLFEVTIYQANLQAVDET